MIARRVKPILLAGVATAALAASASATTLLPGGTLIFPTPGVVPLGSTLLADTGLKPFIGSNTMQTLFTGEYEQWVYRDSITNDLDFVTRVTNDHTSTDSIEGVSLTDYTGFTTDVSWDASTPGGSVAPLIIDRQVTGDTINFVYTPYIPPIGAITPGATAFDTIVKTNATSYTEGTLNMIDGAVSTNTVFAPAVVPEPCTLALLATGGLPLLGFRRRRKLA